jgi:hypothetical protein
MFAERGQRRHPLEEVDVVFEAHERFFDLRMILSENRCPLFGIMR